MASKAIFELSRPVISGAENFLQLARHIGESAIPADTRNGLILPNDRSGIIGDSGPTQRNVIALGQPRFRIYNKLMLPLIQLATTPLSAQNFARASIELSQNTERRRSLTSRLAQIGLSHDVQQPDEEISLSIVGMEVSKPPHKQGWELVLVPDPTDDITTLFIEEHEAYVEFLQRRLKLQSTFSLEQRFTPGIPTAIMAPNTTSQERGKLINGLWSEIPFEVNIGETLPPSSR